MDESGCNDYTGTEILRNKECQFWNAHLLRPGQEDWR